MCVKVLITCGPTWAKLDDVRVLSNQSTGEMGHLIALAFHQKGAKVTLIEGPVLQPFHQKGIKVIKFHFFDELDQILKEQCSLGFDLIIHAAAVSDFKPKQIFKKKIDSSKPLTVEFIKTKKIINDIKKGAPRSRLVGFKLEPDLNQHNMAGYTKGLFGKAKCDLVFANTTTKGYQGFIINSSDHILFKAKDKQGIAKALVRLCTEPSKRKKNR